MKALALFAPEIMSALFSVAAFAFIFVPAGLTRRYLYPVLMFLSAVSVAASIAALGQDGLYFLNTYKLDPFSQIFKLALAGCLFLILCISDRTYSLPEEIKPEYFIFLGTATLGMMMLTSANELITLFISLELASLSQYILVPLRKGKILNAEAGIKYLLFGAAASAITLYGLSFVFGLAQTTFFTQIALQVPLLVQQPIFYAGLFLTGAGFFFKLAAFPFHFWAPDVYEGAATPVTAFIATASKAAGIAVLIRILVTFSPGGAIHDEASMLTLILVWLSIISMTLGNLAAMIQKDMKRMLAYSSIAQAGYILSGLLAQTPQGYVSVVFYTLCYLVMNYAAFMVTVRVARVDDNPGIKSFSGLADRSPLLSLTLMVSLLSLAGIPPLAGFTGKWFVFSAAMDRGHWVLVLVGVINSVISLYYYLMVVRESYLGEPAADDVGLVVDLKTRLLSYVSITIILVLGVYPTPLIDWVERIIG